MGGEAAAVDKSLSLRAAYPVNARAIALSFMADIISEVRFERDGVDGQAFCRKPLTVWV